MKNLLFLIISLCSLCHHVAAQNLDKINVRIIDSGYVFKTAPFSNSHSVSIAEVSRDTLLYVWFGGDYEGAKNVSIWGRFRYPKQKKQWSKLILLAKGKDSSGNPQPCWNPVLFKTSQGRIFLDYKVGPNPREWWAERKTSHDNGKTWSTAQRLPPPYLGPIKNKPIQLKNGDILYPSSTESLDEKTWKIHLEITNAEGKNRKYIAIDNGKFDAIQPTILQYPGKALQMLSRSRQNTIVQTWSYDWGKSWTPLQALDLPNPNSGIDAVSLSNGLQLLVYNPMQSGENWWNGRSILNLALSKNGRDWKNKISLEKHTKGEYSYPAVIEDHKHIVRIAYTYDRKTIKYVDVEIIE